MKIVCSSFIVSIFLFVLWFSTPEWFPIRLAKIAKIALSRLWWIGKLLRQDVWRDWIKTIPMLLRLWYNSFCNLVNHISGCWTDCDFSWNYKHFIDFNHGHPKKIKGYVPCIINGFCMIEREWRKRTERLTDIEELHFNIVR